MMIRDSARPTPADTWLLDTLDQGWRAASAAVRALAALLRRPRRGIRTGAVSDEWLTRHAADAGKHPYGA